MPLEIERKPETVRMVRIQIGKEWAQHDFGRPVDLATARKTALHFLDCMTEGRQHD